MLTGLFARITGILALVGGIVAAVFAIRRGGAQDAINERAAQDAQADHTARVAYDTAGGDPAVVRGRLRDTTKPW